MKRGVKIGITLLTLTGFVFLFLWICGVFSSQTQYVNYGSSISSQDNDAIIVYVTRTGTKYHRDGCRYLSKSQFEISLEDAIDQGYEPCSKCNPPE